MMIISNKIKTKILEGRDKTKKKKKKRKNLKIRDTELIII